MVSDPNGNWVEIDLFNFSNYGLLHLINVVYITEAIKVELVIIDMHGYFNFYSKSTVMQKVGIIPVFSSIAKRVIL